LIPATLLGLPRQGCLNIHASLLPRWRGAAPVEHALLAGDQQSGVTLMQMDPGLDTGAVLWQRAVAIEHDDTAGSLRAKLAELGAQGMLATLESVERGALLAQPQGSTGITYARKIDKKEARLNWSRPAAELARKVRAFNPTPAARGMLDGAPLLVWKAAAVEASGSPGRIIDVSPAGVLVACGEGALRIEELQKPGGRKMTVAQFLAGHRLCEGKILD
ncbi:MAG: methionyl-tRNA formyltransferase, partial [Burkholderiales bacterium]